MVISVHPQRNLLRAAPLGGIAKEIAYVVAHLVHYPTGLGRDEQIQATSRCWQKTAQQAQAAAAEMPVLLIPGLADNRSIFTALRRSLRAHGLGPVGCLRSAPLSQDVPAAAARLARQVERTCAANGCPQVHLVGHSLGGLIARYYVQRLAGHTRVHSVITLATPHGGTRAARLLSLVPLARQLRPGSPLIRELAEPASGCSTRFVAFYSDLDEVIIPAGNARIDHPGLAATNILVPAAGHLALAGHREVIRGICANLAQRRHDQPATRPDAPALPARRKDAQQARFG